MILKKVVFLGAKPIGHFCFSYLLQHQSELQIEVVGLLSRQRKEFGNEHDLIPLAEENNIPMLNSLNEIPPCDIIYSIQYHEILKQEHIAKAAQIAINLHMAPLPEYRGSNQFSFAILEDKKEFGTTIHQIDPRIDHGDILFQKRFPIPDHCWINDLYELTFDASKTLFTDTLQHIVTGEYQPISQASLEGQYGTSLHYRNEIADIKQIDLSWDAARIERHIRATSMPGFEPPNCLINNQKVYFTTKY
jgi:methionyl-tRNA formyltransferase